MPLIYRSRFVQKCTKCREDGVESVVMMADSRPGEQRADGEREGPLDREQERRELRAWHRLTGVGIEFIVAVVLFEVLTTIVDFVIEDCTRRLPWLERVFHTVLAINCGALLVLAAPVLRDWLAAPTALVPVSYGLWSLLLTACGVGVLAWSARDALAARRHFRPAAWERFVVAPPQAEQLMPVNPTTQSEDGRR